MNIGKLFIACLLVRVLNPISESMQDIEKECIQKAKKLTKRYKSRYEEITADMEILYLDI